MKHYVVCSSHLGSQGQGQGDMVNILDFISKFFSKETHNHKYKHWTSIMSKVIGNVNCCHPKERWMKWQNPWIQSKSKLVAFNSSCKCFNYFLTLHQSVKTCFADSNCKKLKRMYKTSSAYLMWKLYYKVLSPLNLQICILIQFLFSCFCFVL